MRQRFTIKATSVTLLTAAGACLLAIAAGWTGYALVAWLGYGKLPVDRTPDPLLDRFMPRYEISERHETRVHAPANITYAAACVFDLEQSPIIRSIFRGRELLLRSPRQVTRLPSQLVAQTLAIGWSVLAQTPGRELVMGAVTQPWEANVTFHAVPADRFSSFTSPGFAQIVWTLSAEPIDARTSIFRTITRVRTTDAASREKFRRYWAMYSPGILLIRSEALRVVRHAAEDRYRSGDREQSPEVCPKPANASI